MLGTFKCWLLLWRIRANEGLGRHLSKIALRCRHWYSGILSLTRKIVLYCRGVQEIRVCFGSFHMQTRVQNTMIGLLAN